jgi:hypothetical protein
MRASTVRLYFALLAAKGEGVFIAKHDCVRHLLEAAALLFQHVAQADSERVGCGVAHLFLSSVFLAVACDIHAERLLAKAGVASCKGRGVPTLEEEAKPERKGRSAAEVCTSEARKIGEAPCGARSGRSPLARLVFNFARGSVPDYWEGVAGGNGPLRFSLACLGFFFSLGVSRGDISLFRGSAARS